MPRVWLPVDEDTALRAGATRTEALQAECPYGGPPPTVQMQRVAAEQARI